MSQENLSNSAGPSCLKRSFGMREAVTITAGSVIGVGLFTTGSNVVGNLGIEVIFATLLALLVSFILLFFTQKWGLHFHMRAEPTNLPRLD